MLEPGGDILIAFYAFVYLSVFPHELGHVIAGKLAGVVPTSFGVGRGRVFLSCSIWGMRFFVGARGLFDLDGYTIILVPQLLPGPLRMTLIFSGGMAVNAIIAALSYEATRLWPSAAFATYGYVLCAANVLLVFIAAIPYRLRVGAAVARSDGYAILNAWLGRTETSPATELASTEALCALFRETADFRGLRANLVRTADVWCKLGDPGRAKQLIDSAEATSVEPLPAHRAYEKLVRASIASEAEQLEDAETLCRAAIKDFLELNHANGLLLAEIVRGGLLRKRGDGQEVAEYYKNLAANPTILKHRQFGEAYRRRFLACQHGFLEGRGTEAVLSSYEAAPARQRSSYQDLQTYRSAARRFAQTGTHALAAAAYAQALEAIAALDKTFTKTDRKQFRLAQAGLIVEAQAELRALIREEEAARLDSFFPSIPEDGCSEKAAGDQRDTRWGRLLRWGSVLSVFNIAVVVVLAKWLAQRSREFTGATTGNIFGDQVFDRLDRAAFALVATLVAGAIFCLLLIIVKRWVPSLRRITSYLILGFSILPWIMGLGISLAMVTFDLP
jgi:hypothetical protein